MQNVATEPGEASWTNHCVQCGLQPCLTRLVCVQCEGVGKDSIPGAIDFDVVDDMMQVTDKQSFTVCYTTMHFGIAPL